MKFEILNGQHVYAPEDPLESRLVFHVLQEKLSLQVPGYVERDRENCDACRSGAWFAWPFYLPFERESDSTRSLVVNVALPVTFWDTADPLVRWDIVCQNCDPQRDEADLLGLLKAHVNARLQSVREERLFQYLRLLDKASRI